MTDDTLDVMLCCNGDKHSLRLPTDRLLVDVLREDLELTGTKLGCGTGDCGACTVLLDGQPVCSCQIYAVECEGSQIETIEAVAETKTGRLVAESFCGEGAVQCGICTPGFVVSVTAFLNRHNGVPDRAAMEEALAGNLCRCTGYFPIIRAVRAAAERRVVVDR